MRRLIVGTFVSLDGIMQSPGGPDEDRDGGFEHGGWLVPLFDEKMGQIMTDWTNKAGGFLLGRRTYEIFAGSWPKSTDPDDQIAAALNTRPKYVASRTLDTVSWHNSSLLRPTWPPRSPGSSSKTAASSKCTVAATLSRRCSSTTSWTGCDFGCSPSSSAPASVCSAKAPFRPT